MKILNRYIRTAVLVSNLKVFFILLALFLLIKLSDNMRYLNYDGFYLADVFLLTFYAIAQEVKLLSSFAFILGTFLAVHKLHAARELLALQSIGFSEKNILYAALTAVVPIAVGLFILVEFVAPDFKERANAIKAQNAATENSVWLKIGDGYLKSQVLPDINQLRNISFYSLDSDFKLQHLLHAKTAEFKTDAWLLKDVLEYDFSGAKLVQNVSKEKVWQSKVTANNLQQALLRPDVMSLFSLCEHILFLDMIGHNSLLYKLNFAKRILFPFNILAMCLFAFCLVVSSFLGDNFKLKLAVGILSGFMFIVASEVGVNIGLTLASWYILGAVAPCLLFVILSGVLLYKK